MFLDSSRLIAGNDPRLSNGVAVSDVDGDGAFEVIVAGQDGPNLVLKWDDGRLVDIADPVLADSGGAALSIAAADMDGDGREEIYILNAGGGDRLLACFGDRWVDLMAQPENHYAGPAAGRAVAAVDRNGTGRYGLVVATEGEPFRLYELTRRGRLDDVAEEAGVDVIAPGCGLCSVPLFSERMDILAGIDGGPNLAFRNLGDGGFEDVAEERGLTDTRSSSRAIVAFDADGDGVLDLLVGNHEGPQRLFLQRSGIAFAEVAGADLSLPARIGSVVVADFDNDGHEELFFNIQGDRNRLFAWRHDEWQEIDPGDAAEPKALGTGMAFADVDGDGRLELVVAHGQGHAAPLSLYRPVPNTNSWLRVLPLTAAGAPARGAVVICRAGGRVQTRAVCAGSGYRCQMEPVAHFGLGQVRSVEQVEVRWPDGMVAVIEAPPLGRVLTVPHPPE